MYMAATIPEKHISARYTIDIVAQVVVGPKVQSSRPVESVNHLLGIATGHHTDRSAPSRQL